MKKILYGVVISAFFIACNDKADEKTESAASSATAAESKKTTGDELLPMSETESVKKGLIAFSKGDIDGMTAEYADTASQLWSSLDSLVGKKAIQEYYKKRWAIIDSLNFSDFVIVPLKMAEQQTPIVQTGKWVLAWAFAHVKYKNGKKLDFWVHNVYHYNSANKIDFVGQYLDRHPIMEATKGL